MSRGVKDLRDLIAVSRLSFRDSDDDDEYSESTDCISTTDDDKPNPSNASYQSSAGGGSDSGILSTDPSPELVKVGDTNSNALSPVDTSPKTDCISKKQKKKKKSNKFRQYSSIVTVPECFPSTSTLPPILSNVSKPNNSSSEMEAAHPNVRTENNFDRLMLYIDANVVSNWLKRANTVLQELASWVHQTENFVQFANFWLTSFSLNQKREIFELEYGVLIDEIGLAFKSGLDTRAVDVNDFNSLGQAVFREYPGRLLGCKGPYMFLDYLDILSSERTDEYRRVLTDVKLSTKNKTYAQWILALRSFGLVNIWSAVISFYRELVFRGHVTLSRPNTAQKSKSKVSSPADSIWIKRTHMAINCNSVQVLHYIISTKKINPNTLRDSDKRNLIFQAVSSQKPDILMYLIKEVHPLLDVNSPSDTGNTPLHAAACSGNLEIVKILIESGKAELNPLNKQCDNSTPLHMAVMYGHANIVKYLTSKGANFKLKMNGVDARQLAKDFEQTECLHIIDGFISQKKASS